jgi:hypothetical protein
MPFCLITAPSENSERMFEQRQSFADTSLAQSERSQQLKSLKIFRVSFQRRTVKRLGFIETTFLMTGICLIEERRTGGHRSISSEGKSNLVVGITRGRAETFARSFRFRVLVAFSEVFVRASRIVVKPNRQRFPASRESLFRGASATD